MSYIPTAEKLVALGFKSSNTEGHFFEREDQVTPQIKRWMTIGQRKDGRAWLHESFYTSGPVEAPRDAAVYCAALPSEEFFDQLLVAVGWQSDLLPIPTPDFPARWIPVKEGDMGIFLTRNGKYMTSAEPVDGWKINKYGLKYWLYNMPSTPQS